MRVMPDGVDVESGGADPPDQLPRGRHKLPLETVRASQRQRLLRAMLESVAERGYGPTTVPQVVAAARVGRNAFYELFADKLDCFLVLCEELTDELLQETFELQAVGDWRDAVREGAVRYLAWWQARPMVARACLVELPTAGPRALEQQMRAYARFAERFELVAALARSQRSGLAPMRRNTARALAWGVGGLVAEEVAAGRAGQLASLEDDVVALIQSALTERAD
jgi:AcrR family transcriptional regulator